MWRNCVPVVAWSHDCGKDKLKLIVSCLVEVFPRTLVSEGRIYEGNLQPSVTNEDRIIVCLEWSTNWCNNSPRKKENVTCVFSVMMKSINYPHLTRVIAIKSIFSSYAGELHLVLCLHCVLRHSLWPQENIKFRKLQLQVVFPNNYSLGQPKTVAHDP